MRWSDLAPALLLLGLSAAIFLDTRHLEFYGETTPGPAFLPVWLAIAGLVLAVLRLAEARRVPGAGVDWPDRPARRRIILILAGLVAVPLAAPVLGLMPSLILFMAFLLIGVLRQKPLPSLATIAVTGGFVYAIFAGWLRVPLPVGIFGF